MDCTFDIVEHHPISPLTAMAVDDEMKFELEDLAARALIPSEVRDEPQIFPGRGADVEETEGMSTPYHEP